MWAMFGIARLPGEGEALRGVSEGEVTAWQYADASDTLSYARTGGKQVKLVTEMRHAGKIVGRAETTLDSTGAPLSARLLVPSVPAKLDLTFLSTSRADFAPEIWTDRKP